MTNSNSNSAPTFGGARILTPQEAADIDLGPLQQLPGTWVSQPGVNTQGTTNPSNGWNEMSIPGPNPNGEQDGFTFEVIPYHERLTFKPAVIQAGNRGPFPNPPNNPGIGQNETEVIYGLIYEQEIISDCNTGLCQQLGFQSGASLHVETGMLLYIQQPTGFSSDFNIARLGTVPHGNSYLALGQSAQVINPGTNFFPNPSPLPLNPKTGELETYGQDQFYAQQFPEIFNQLNPAWFLISTLEAQQANITNMVVLPFSTKPQGAGVLNIPFVNKFVPVSPTSQASAVNFQPAFDAIFWIEEIAGQDALQLQYLQTINLVFPPTGSNVPIMWPHINLNTLTKIDNGSFEEKTSIHNNI